jgi:serine/threonine-protein kinase
VAIKGPNCDTADIPDFPFWREWATPLPSSKDVSVSQTESLQTPIQELTTDSPFAGRYQVIEELGKGGMGKVHRVLATKLKEEVAPKLIKPGLASEKEPIELEGRERRVAKG